jgi:hypothetical protein
VIAGVAVIRTAYYDDGDQSEKVRVTRHTVLLYVYTFLVNLVFLFWIKVSHIYRD